MKRIFLFSLVLRLCSVPGIAQTAGKVLPLYLNQEPPGSTPRIFAPDRVSLKDRYEFGSVFSRDGKEFYYAVEIARRPHIEYMTFENNRWSQPVKVLFSEKYGYNDPFLSPDEQRLYFISDQALDGKGDKKDIDIWYVEREKGGWSKPINAGKEINSPHNEYYISFTRSSTMYYSSNKGAEDVTSKKYDIYFSPFSNHAFGASTKLSDAVNSEHYEADVFVSPDEQYLIYCAERPDGHGQGDLFISFKDNTGQWGKAKNMGNAINTPGYEFCPFVTADGKYLFFSRDGDIYWVDAKVIDELR
jgi:Tol biopolymer transport system component